MRYPSGTYNNRRWTPNSLFHQPPEGEPDFPSPEKNPPPQDVPPDKTPPEFPIPTRPNL